MKIQSLLWKKTTALEEIPIFNGVSLQLRSDEAIDRVQF